jgi:integrase
VALALNGESHSVRMNTVLTTTLKAVRMNTVSLGSVFYHRQGTLYCSFRTAFERAVRKASVADFIFHDLRHTLAVVW